MHLTPSDKEREEERERKTVKEREREREREEERERTRGGEDLVISRENVIKLPMTSVDLTHVHVLCVFALPWISLPAP